MTYEGSFFKEMHISSSEWGMLDVKLGILKHKVNEELNQWMDFISIFLNL